MLAFMRNKKGFTLIELLISMAILTIIIVPLSSLFVSSVKINSTSKEMLLANQLAQKYLEEYKHHPNPVSPTPIPAEGGLTVTVSITPEPPLLEPTGTPTPVNSFTYSEPSLIDFTINLEASGAGKVDYFYNQTPLFSGDDLNANPITFTLRDGGIVDKLLLKHMSTSGTDINPSDIEYDIVHAADKTEYNMKILCNGKSTTPVTINLTNRTDKKLNVYKVYNVDSNGSNNVKINTYDGTIKIFSNNYQSPTGNYSEYYHKITVTVTDRNGKTLVTLYGINK